MDKKTITIDPSNYKGLIQLMEQYGNSDQPYAGETENGDRQMVSIYSDHIVTKTIQSNGWTRVDTYWKDGTTEEDYEK